MKPSSRSHGYDIDLIRKYSNPWPKTNPRLFCIDYKMLGIEFKSETQKVKGQGLESWSHNNLSDNAEFEFDETTVGDHRVVILTIHA